MTDTTFPYGLGAIPSPADPRDWQLPLDMATPLPAKYKAPNMVPPLNQGTTPQCVAYSSAEVRQWQEKPDNGGSIVALDPGTFYKWCQAIDGIPGPHDGTTLRAAMSVMKNKGYPPAGNPANASHFRTQAYYAVPMNVAAMKTAIYTVGPINVAAAFANSWAHPVKHNGAIVCPPFDSSAGGHAFVLFGWDDTVTFPGTSKVGGFYLLNSWGPTWGANGTAYIGYDDLIAHLHDAWKSADLRGDAPTSARANE